MRYPKEHKEQARQRLVEGGARLAKRRGFTAAGVDDLAAASGVTSGAVYRHFSGKSELLEAIIEAELGRSAALFASVPAGDVEKLGKALAAYLSPEHVEHPEFGCALPSLAADVARSDAGVRRAFEDGLRAVHGALKRHVGSGDVAWVLIAQSVGAVMLARAMPDDATRGKLLAAVKGSARAAVAAGSE
ncbi:MAG TPA: TetR/AcrR family transcriptional regulator [Burkholderiaceae bacterium]|nr:TetR/AcrR family transcriptional regulator [Burkholderiaceae bacterium]HQR71889.1 TetR/AcrR family transcriptional regulator [Burkholderiaceae bacterium]